MTFECLLDSRCGVGESPIYDPDRACIFFVDIPGFKLYRTDLDGGQAMFWTFDSEVACIGLARSGRLVVALRDTIVLFDPDRGTTVATIAEVEKDVSDTRLNDGKVGPDGAFWVGTMHEPADRRPVASLYRVLANGTVEQRITGLYTSNGLAWSADGAVMYHSDSRGPFIDRWAFDAATGTISDRRRFATLSEEQGRPDGGATDVDGCYWSAGVSAGVLNRFSPEGTLLATHRLPVATPTMPCFAGPDRKTLVVTSLRHKAEGLEDRSGGLFIARSAVAGVAINRFDDSGL